MTDIALPGFGAPAVGFDTPFALLHACHERVQRTLALQHKLVGYLHQHTCDEQARQAARDVLRYFDIAAPLHHEDEERHVFPPLLAQGDAATVARVQQLQREHLRMAADWQRARLPLQALAQGQQDAFSQDDEAALARFASHYAAHLRSEEDVVYPAAQAVLSDSTLRAMGQEMRQRRGAPE